MDAPKAPQKRKATTQAAATDPPAKAARTEITFGVLEPVPAELRDTVEQLARRVVNRLEDDAEKAGPDLDRYLDAGVSELAPAVAGPITEPKGQLTPTGRIKRFAKNALEEKLDIYTSDMTIAGVTFNGKWLDEGYVSGPAPKNPVRDLQLTNHISQTMLSAVSAKTAEIEAMVVNNRIVVSANEAATVQELCQTNLAQLITVAAGKTLPSHEERKAEKLGALYNALRGQDSAEQTGTYRLADLAVDCYLWPEQAESVRAVLNVLRQAHRPIVAGGSAQQAAAKINDAQHAGRVIAVDAIESTAKKVKALSHAEQNLALALSFSGHRGPVAISGGKRPCTVCYWSLGLVQKRGFAQLRFNPRPGGFWEGTTATGLYQIVAALRLDKTGFMETFKALNPGDLEQYVTDITNADAPLEDLVEDLVGAVERREAYTASNTQSQSPTHPSHYGEDEEEEEPLSQTT